MNLNELVELCKQPTSICYPIINHSSSMANGIEKLTKTGGKLIIGVKTTRYRDGRVTVDDILNTKEFYIDAIMMEARNRLYPPINFTEHTYIINGKQIYVMDVSEDNDEQTKLMRIWVSMRTYFLENGIYGSKYTEFIGQMMMLEKILTEIYHIEEFPEDFIESLNLTTTNCPACKRKL